MSKFTQKAIDNLKRPILIKEIKSINTNLPKEKSPGPDKFTDEFHQKFKEEIIPVLYNLFQKTEAEIILPNLFYEAIITLITKKDKDATNKKATQQYLSWT